MNLKTAVMLLVFLCLTVPVYAEDPSVLVGGGVAYNSESEQSVSGTFFFAKNLDEAKDTFSISYIDAYPVFTDGKLRFHATSIQTGIARKLLSVSNTKIFGLFDAGAAVGGDSVKFAASYGLAVPVKLKGPVYLIPTGRALYDGISGNHGAVLGINIAFGATQ